MSQFVRTSFALESEGNVIHILPPGPVVNTRDSRSFKITDPARMIAASELPMLLDWEHDSERYDGSTQAAGWIESLESRPTGTWARVSWTPDGKRDVTSFRYRYLSPVLELDAETLDVISIVSVALTNRPALRSLSSIGDARAYRERVRIACSTRTVSLVSPSERIALRKRGMSDADINAAAKHQAATRAQRYAERPSLSEDPSDAELRAHLVARGMSAADYDIATKHQAELRASRMGG